MHRDPVIPIDAGRIDHKHEKTLAVKMNSGKK